MSTVMDSYPVSNQDALTTIGLSTGFTGRGQTFTGDGSYIESVDFYVYQTASNGTFTAKIYAHDGGTFGTSGLPTGTALATSVSRAASGIHTGSITLVRFWFVGSNQFKTVNGTKYVAVAELASESAGNTNFGMDTSSASHSGNAVYNNGSTWVTSANDTIFYVNGKALPDSGFNYKKAITIDYTKCGTADSKNYPLKLALGSYAQSSDNDIRTTANGGFVTNASGYDIRPYADSALTTPLDYELVYYNASSGKLGMDIRIPTLSVSSNTIIYLAFGNSSLTNDSSFAGVWDGDFVGVYHLGDGTTLGLGDSTKNGYTLTNNNSTPAVAGQVGGGAQFTGNLTNYLSNSSLPMGSVMTISMWVYSPSANQNNQTTSFSLGNSDDPNRVVLLQPYNNGTYYWDAGNDTSGRSNISFAGMSDAWYYVTVVHDSTGANDHRIYWNGTSQTNKASSTTPSTTGIYIGGWPTYSQYFYGNMGEVRVSKVVRASSWVTADYNAQKASANLFSWGSKTWANAALPNKTITNRRLLPLNRNNGF